ncbi:MAG: DUF4123 domain-containing protein [Deltaproteobacteria bacterium]|nr:DUF4123 domain-containing protein [Deltaproteobacteria bacterium]
MTQFLTKLKFKNIFFARSAFNNIFKTLFILFICGTSCSSFAQTKNTQAPHPLKDQIWTIEQAKRGNRSFFESCSACLTEHFEMSGPYQNERYELQRASRNQARFLYVIIDSLDYSDLIKQVQKYQNKKSQKKQTEILVHSFYENTFFEKLEDKAPYLVQIEAKHPFLDKIFQRHQENKHPLLFFTSFYGPQKILSHLQDRMLAKIEGNEKVLNFRLYDPLVFKAFFEKLSEEEKSNLMGPIDSARIWDGEKKSWDILNNPQKHLLQINATQIDALGQLALEAFHKRAIIDIQKKEPELRQSFGESQVLTALRIAHELGKKNGITSERDVTAFAVLILKHGDLRQKPQAMKIIQDKKLSSYQKISQLSTYLEDKGQKKQQR